MSNNPLKSDIMIHNKITQGYKDSALGIIPQEWEVKRLGEICLKITDGTHDTPIKQTSGQPFLTAIHVKDGRISYDECYYLSVQDHVAIYKRCNPEKGDILMVNIGAGVCSAAMNRVDYEFSMKNIALLKPNKAFIIGEYFESVLLSNKKKYINSLLNGGAQPFLGLDDISKMKLILPSLPEQKKIAEILGVWDSAIEKQGALVDALTRRKRALMQQLLTAKKRLPNFTGPWKTVDFDSAYNIIPTKKYQIPKSEYNDHGARPIVDQGKKLIVAYTDIDNCFIDTPVIVFGDHTRIIKWIDFDFMIGADGVQVLHVKKIMDLKFGYFMLQNTPIPNLGYSRHMRELKLINFDIPSIPEQQAIAEVLSIADQEIELAKKRLKAFRTQKSALMQQLLTGKKRVKKKNIKKRKEARAKKRTYE